MRTTHTALAGRVALRPDLAEAESRTEKREDRSVNDGLFVHV